MKIIRRDFLKTAIASVVIPAVAGADTLRLAAQAAAGPSVQFPTAPRERIAIASYPFRDFITGRRDAHATSSKMPIKEFAAHVKQKFNVIQIEPWSEHFVSLDAVYLDDLREAVKNSGCAFANIAADGEDSFYALDPAVRARAVAFGKKWIDVAAHIGSPSLRINLPAAEGAEPDAALVAESLRTLATYAASKNIVVHHENDNPVSEDPFFIGEVLDRVHSPWLYSLPDFGNSLAALPAEDAYRALDLMFAHAYGISHAKDPITNNKGVIVAVDLPRVFAIAKKHNYKGYFSMEWDTDGDPYAGTTKLVAATLQNLS